MNKIIVVIGAIFSSVLFLVDCSLVNIKKEKIVSISAKIFLNFFSIMTIQGKKRKDFSVLFIDYFMLFIIDNIIVEVF